MPEKSEKKACVWVEHNAKNFMYVPSCIGTPVNIFKTSKRTGKSIVSLMQECPFCHNKPEFIFP